MASFSNIQATTELEAVSVMLKSIGEMPLPSTWVQSDLDATVDASVVLAKSLLRDALREVQTEPWKFNTEKGVRHDKTASFSWTDNDGIALQIGIFLPPSCISWSLTKCAENKDLDIILLPSQQYRVSGNPVNVMYDRTYHRDGPELAKHPCLYIDKRYALDFTILPETARRYVTVLASRRYAQQTLGSEEKSRFAREDESGALRLLKRDQGETEKLNMMDNAGTSLMMGRPPYRVDAGFRILRNKG